MAKVEINQLPLSTVVSGPNDYIAIDHSNGDGTYTTKKVTPNSVAGLSPVATLTAIEFIAKANTGYPLNPGVQGYLVAPYTGVINSATILGDASGSLVLDIWKCRASAFDAGVTHPVSADSICSATPPTLTNASISKDATLAGWTTAFTAGDILAFSISSTDRKITALTLALSVTKASTP